MFDKIKDIFDMGKYDELEKEQKIAWERIVKAEDSIKGLADTLNAISEDPDKEAQNDSRVTKTYRTRAKNALDELNQAKEEINLLKTELHNLKEFYEARKAETAQAAARLKQSEEQLDARTVTVQGYLAKFEEIIAEYPDVHTDVEALEDTIASANDSLTKIQTIQKNIVTRKTEIDIIHNEVFGHTEEGEDGEDVPVEGKVDKLDKAYSELEKKAQSLSKSQETQLTQVETTLKDKTDEWETQIEELKSKVRQLMPEALTAGLASAYTAKKDAEEKTLSKYEYNFSKAITATVAVSLIPFAVSIFMLSTGKALDEVILKAPNMVLSMMPLYVPVVWMAYSANKNAKLSKRLIEEYTHKEVLSKTYEGLATQIENLGEGEVSDELRIKLLTNILNISGENPGKLISDYNKSDHPVIDVLEKSTKLTESLENLRAIPGFGKLAKRWAKAAEADFQRINKQAERGLDVVDDE